MKKVLNITKYQGNANQNHNQKSPQPYAEGLLPRRQDVTSVGRGVKKTKSLQADGGTVR